MRAAAVCLLALASIAWGGRAQSQEADHQRLSVQRDSRHGVEGSLALSWSAADRDWAADWEVSLEYGWRKALAFSLAMPWSISKSAKDEAARAAFRWGDPGAAVSYLWRDERYRMLAGLDYSYPLERRAGMGFHRLSPSLSLGIVRDPVVLTLGASLASGLPRQEGGYLLWPALSGNATLSYWELLNDRISFRVAVSPGFSLGLLRLGMADPPIPRWRLGLSMTVAWDERAWGVQAGWSGAAPTGPGTVDARGSLRGEW